ncbi:hypothetical protein ACFSTD_13075 [Novosphingobium colocasiae]
MKRTILVLVMLAVLWFGAHIYAAWRIRTALIEGGMNEKAAACMSRRLSKRLTLWQMHKLEAFQEEKNQRSAGWCARRGGSTMPRWCWSPPLRQLCVQPGLPDDRPGLTGWTPGPATG